MISGLQFAYVYMDMQSFSFYAMVFCNPSLAWNVKIAIKVI